MPMGKETLHGALTRLGVTQAALGEVLGLSQPSVHRKIHGLREWNRGEINVVLAYLQKLDASLSYETLFGDRSRGRVAQKEAVA